MKKQELIDKQKKTWYPAVGLGDKTVIDTSTLNEGVYTLTIKSVTHIINKRVVIVR